jgi:hypothetical protein
MTTAIDLSQIRPSRLWKQLPDNQRLQTARDFWTDEQSGPQQEEAIALMAEKMKFRPKTLRALPAEKKARYLSSISSISDTLAARLLVIYHLEMQRPMMASFLDDLGIVHQEGLISEQEVKAPDPARLAAAVNALAAKYPREDVTRYLSTLWLQDPETWSGFKELNHLRSGD